MEIKQQKARIEWLAVLQGFSMLLVVLGHITLTDSFQDPDYPIVAAMERIILLLPHAAIHLYLGVAFLSDLSESGCLISGNDG